MLTSKPERMMVTWSDLKAVTLRLMQGDTSDFKIRSNASMALECVSGNRVDFRGFTRGQLERWLSEGFQTQAMHGLEEFIPPIREKRRFVFLEEGDEFHVDMALSGQEICMSMLTKRDEIPGLAIEAEISMQAGVNAEILNRFYTWICQVAFSCESAGIDIELSLTMLNSNLHNGGGITNTVVKVKSENEQTDFRSWSAMVSPASLRGLGFIAKMLSCDRNGKTTRSGKGGLAGSRVWGVTFDPDSRTLKIGSEYSPRNFPEELMNAKLREALKEATNSARK